MNTSSDTATGASGGTHVSPEQIALELRKLELEERKLSQEGAKRRYTLTQVLMAALITALGSVIAGLSVALVKSRSDLALKKLELAQAVQVQQSIAELELGSGLVLGS